MTNKYSIAILLPTRSRTTALTESVTSIVSKASDLSKIQILFGFDDDDSVGLAHFENVIQPFLDEHNVDYEAQAFRSMGYAALNRYYNHLAQPIDADWFFIWNDDAVMETQGWDDVIRSYDGQFKLLKVHTHNEHPYSIFPIVPQSWYKLFGYFSRHQMIDAELSQIAYCLDLIEIVKIDVIHNQVELTQDATDPLKPKVRFEGNPNNPWDFHHPAMTKQRYADCEVLASYAKTQGIDTSWWEKVRLGQQDPWEKMRANDVNKQMMQYNPNA
jgi:hypothetical protein